MTINQVRPARVRLADLSVYDDDRKNGTWVGRVGPDGPRDRRLRTHRRHRIAWVTHGQATVRGDDCHWKLPPTQAIWLPSGTPHHLWGEPASSLHVLEVTTDEGAPDWREPVVLAVTPMLRELLLTVSAAGTGSRVSDATETLLFALLKPLSHTTLQLPLPTDYRALALAQAVLSRPADRRTLEEWADYFDTSARALRDAFTRETGLTFDEWRTQARLRASLTLLAECTPADTVAHKVGYASADDFIDAFRRHFGHTPGRPYEAARP